MTFRAAISTVSMLALLAACMPGVERSGELFSWRLPAIGGPVLDLASLEENRASAIVFVAPDCPLSQNHTLTLNNLADRFAADSIRFYGVVAGEWYTDEEVSEFVTTYRVGFPVLMDYDYRVTALFDARVTPEVFVIDSRGATVYEGAIDDWAGALGQHRPITTRHYLEDALTNLASGEEVAVGSVDALGCFIERPS